MLVLLASVHAAQLPCQPVVHSTLPGVTIEVPEQPCDFVEGEMAGNRFTWVLVVEGDVGTVVNTSGGRCGRPDASGFTPSIQVAGGGLIYRDDDHGVCRRPEPEEVTARPSPGRTPRRWLWEGHAWSGPSCTSEPYGPAFPPGDYSWSIVLEGTREGAPWRVSAEVPVRILPAPRP